VRDVSTFAEMVDAVPPRYLHPIDPDDSHYIDLALAANAKLIVSWDNHLLSLTDDNVPAGQDFRSRFPELMILSPVQLLARIGSK